MPYTINFGGNFKLNAFGTSAGFSAHTHSILWMWVVEELKGRLVAKDEPFPLFHSPIFAFLAKLKTLGSLLSRLFWPYADLVGIQSEGVPPVSMNSLLGHRVVLPSEPYGQLLRRVVRFSSCFLHHDLADG